MSTASWEVTIVRSLYFTEIYSYDSIQLIMCRRKLLQSAHNARMRIPFTHFACFPVYSNATTASFNKFREDVMKKCGGVSRCNFVSGAQALQSTISTRTSAVFHGDFTVYLVLGKRTVSRPVPEPDQTAFHYHYTCTLFSAWIRQCITSSGRLPCGRTLVFLF